MDETRKIVLDSDENLSKYVTFWQVNKEDFPEQFGDVADTSRAIYRFYKRGEIVHELVGANGHEYRTVIKKFKPTDNEMEED
mmetsp:Transcript_105971/g.228386  ORF Transcript_105971/g.228386 Transcript_105971/m.228386 type:complete len:82 (+) Transcript_105971:135-380(+)|eukprot:CAMPEP_0116946868 /NCGR_PEP_ID=MMETSP0467-20121206/37284_1 /TAXON_ID=283647 /ORGANISM="Mesodinium pulex, Strain SPMC105" /LENGTH=81 /DNA_ID=CAMNT_0004630813 /DNA_START=123 /DNA_END=368 /DNA_ORIENTATION=+